MRQQRNLNLGRTQPTREVQEVASSSGSGPPGDNGNDGASAYEIAVANGFVGDEVAWLASLVGAPGDNGDPGPAGPGGAILNFHSDGGTNLTLTNQAAALQGLANNARNEVMFDATDMTEVRVAARVVTASASTASPRLFPQYWNGSAWVTVGTGTGTEALPLTPVGAKATNWIALPEGARADVVWRIAQQGGDGVADPALGNVSLQFR